MAYFTRRLMIGPALFLTTALVVVAFDNSVGGSPLMQKDKKDKDKDKEKKDFKDGPGKEGPGKAAKDLRKAYDSLTEISQASLEGKESGRVLDYAKRFYREAVKAYHDDPRRAADLAAAANDLARGLEHLWRAGLKPVPGLPEPPVDLDRPFGGPKGKGPPSLNAGPGQAAEPGPWSESLETLTATRDRLSGMDGAAPVNGPSRDVTEAAKAVYAQARSAYEAGDYRKAAQLARAAEAWSHVPEHLSRAGVEPPSPPAPGPMPRVKSNGAPPAPPPIRG